MPRWDADSNEINPSADSKLMSVDEFGALRYIKSGKLQAFVQGKIFGTIAHDAVAPTPGEPGEYTFSTGGVCTWLDVFPDTNTVIAGDTVKVIYDVLLDTYSYELVPNEGSYATVGELEAETADRIAGDNALQASIENLSGEIGSESLARTAGDNALQASIENLSGEIGSESLARTAGDNALQAAIDNLSGEIGSESLARIAGDNALQASIDNEILDRQTAIQGVVQTVNSNTEEIQNEITNRTQTVNALRNELLSKTIGSIETGAEQKPAEGVSRRYRFTNDGNCYFTDVLNGLTFDVMPVPFVVSKDDELSVIQYGENYTYIYHKIASNYATKVEIGDIETALDNIHTAMTAVIMEMEAL